MEQEHDEPMTGSLFQEQLRSKNCEPRFYAYYYKQWNNYRMNYHDHDSTEIMYIISGMCRVDVQMPDGREEQTLLKKGQFILIDAGIPHRLIVEDGAACRMLNVEFGFAISASSALGQSSIRQLALEEEEVQQFLQHACAYLVLPDPEEVYYIMKSLVLELDQRGLSEQGRSFQPMRVIPQEERWEHREARNLKALDQGILVRTLFIQLLIRVARLRGEMSRSASDQTELYVKRTVEFMHQNMDRSIQMKDIAAAVNLHPGYLHRIFRQHTQRTPTDYLTMLRMEKAKMLLQQTDIPISEISDYVGVGSRQYFHMLFKKYTSVTPVAFRSSKDRHVSHYPMYPMEE